METWNLFSNSDIVYAIIGAAGLVSVIIVMRTALSNTNRYERQLKNNGKRSSTTSGVHEGGTPVSTGPDD